MELRHLKYFLTVAEEMNFTRAAEKLMIAQPPLSRQIKDLEEELGSPLFIREHHSLRLTDEGVLFREYATRMVALSEESVESIKAMKKGLSGTLYLSEVEGKAPHLMAEWISGFSKLYPDVQYFLWNGNSDEVVKRVDSGLSDVGIILEPYDPDRIHSMKVYSEPWVAMFSADDPLCSLPGDTLKVSDLAAADLLIPSRVSRLKEIEDWFIPLGVHPHIKARIANVVTAYELAEAGVGVAIFPAAAKDMVRENDRVQIREIDDVSIIASYILIYSAERPLSHVASEFVVYVRSQQKGSDLGQNL